MSIHGILGKADISFKNRTVLPSSAFKRTDPARPTAQKCTHVVKNIKISRRNQFKSTYSMWNIPNRINRGVEKEKGNRPLGSAYIRV